MDSTRITAAELEQTISFGLDLDRATMLMKLPRKVKDALQTPDCILKFDVTIDMDDGSRKHYPAWRVQHSNMLGVYKGGIRYHHEVHELEVRRLAYLMALKTSVCGAPAGGAKGGVCVNPKELSEAELKRLSLEFGRLLAPHIGPEIDVPAGDVGTPGKVMNWLLEGGKLPPATITSKPVADGGDPFREAATGYGTALAARNYFDKRGKTVEGKTTIIQGYGNVGSFCGEYLDSWGSKIVGVTNSRLGIYNKDGFASDLLKQFKAEGVPRTAEEAAKYGEVTTPDDILVMPCDILAPCALFDVIHADNADKIFAEVLVEGANGPCDPMGDAILGNNRCTVVAGIVANAGGVACSMYEWEANLANKTFTHDESKDRLTKQLTNSFDRVWDFKKTTHCSFRVAANCVAIERLVEAMKEKGRI